MAFEDVVNHLPCLCGMEMADKNQKGIWMAVPSTEHDVWSASNMACTGKHQLCLHEDVFWHIYVWTQEEEAL